MLVDNSVGFRDDPGFVIKALVLCLFHVFT